MVNVIIAILILISPILFYSYIRFPEVKTWETNFFVFNSNYYENVKTFAWVFLQKFVFLYLMLIWFFTCNQFWNKAILVPIGMIIYQIITLLNDEVFLKDELKDAVVVVPIAIAVCIFLFVIHKKLSFYTKALDLKKQIDLEISQLEKE